MKPAFVFLCNIPFPGGRLEYNYTCKHLLLNKVRMDHEEYKETTTYTTLCVLCASLCVLSDPKAQ